MRGYQKKVIHIKNTGSYLFDEAYFVLSREGEMLHVGEDDMVTEANRIINDERYRKLKNSPIIRYKKEIISALCGIIIGTAVSFILFYF